MSISRSSSGEISTNEVLTVTKTKEEEEAKDTKIGREFQV